LIFFLFPGVLAVDGDKIPRMQLILFFPKKSSALLFYKKNKLIDVIKFKN